MLGMKPTNTTFSEKGQVQKIPYDDLQRVKFKVGKKYCIFLGKDIEMVSISHKARTDTHRINVEGSG